MWDSIEQNGLKLMKGVMELLIYLRQSDYRIAIASSSGDQVIERYLEIAGMRQYFDRIVGGNQIQNSKPSPDIYLKACEVLGANPPDTIAVGCSTPFDILPAVWLTSLLSAGLGVTAAWLLGKVWKR